MKPLTQSKLDRAPEDPKYMDMSEPAQKIAPRVTNRMQTQATYDLIQKEGGSFRNDILDLEHLKLRIMSREDIVLAHEIYHYRAYQFMSRGPLRVIDVGMNKGMASLYFAADDRVTEVFGFEPFRDTYNQALDQFALNPGLSPRIQTFNYGLYSENITAEILYNPKHSTLVQASEERELDMHNQNSYLVRTDLRKASGVISGLFGSYPQSRWLLKIDVEGDEIEILKDLHQNSLLSNFSEVLLEWHGPHREECECLLRFNGFECRDHYQSLQLMSQSYASGMIYGLRH